MQRQVPAIKSPFPSYGLVGNGRLARHLVHYFSLLGIPLPPVHGETTHILVAITDSAIANVIEIHPEWRDRAIIHFSGALSLPGVHSAHPLMTFADQLYELETYKSVPFITERGKADFTELFPQLPNRHFAIPGEMKPLYHAYCAIAGNFSTILWQETLKSLHQDFDLPSDILQSYLAGLVNNFKHDPDGALTGPIARRDLVTIEKHLAALKMHPLAEIYEAFLRFKKIPEVRGP